MKKHLRYLFFVNLAGLFLLAPGAWLLTPSLKEVQRQALGSDRVLRSAQGELLQTLRTDFKKRRLAWYPLSQFPKTLQEALLLAEDRRFGSHFGFDPVGLARAAVITLRGKPVQGASTITMQLSDLIQEDVLIHNQPIRKGSLRHKFLQILRAVLLEIKWSKKEILEAYLNLIHLRGEFQGVPAASYAYLNKNPLALDPEEAFVLASLISSPNQKAEMLKRKACFLFQKKDSASEVAEADETCHKMDLVIEKLTKARPTMPRGPEWAPHLSRRLFKESPEEPFLTSTLDASLQKEVTSILEKNLHRLRDLNVHDTAAIVIENKTGKVLAYVGTVSTSQNPHVDGVQAYRQAGSALKPFLYARALETRTLTAASILWDDPTAISWNGDVYRPSNYDKHFYGPVSVREALGSSLNVPAVKTVTILGLHETYKALQSLQLSNLKEPDFYGVSMALGAVEVRLDELANAYRMLANGGLWSPLRFISEDLQKPLKSHRIFSPPTAYIMSSILSDSNARSIGFGWNSPLETSVWTAVKTGTSKDYRDNWCVGFSETYTVAVWAGNFNAEAMKKVSGVTGVGPSWAEIMLTLHRQEPGRPPKPPSGVVTKKIRHQWANHDYEEFFIQGTEPSQDVIEPALEKRLQFIFPAEGSILVKDPHLDQDHVALFIRFKGLVPEQSQLLWNGKVLGPAVSPFKIPKPPSGEHTLAIASKEGSIYARVHFTIRGAQ